MEVISKTDSSIFVTDFDTNSPRVKLMNVVSIDVNVFDKVNKFVQLFGLEISSIKEFIDRPNLSSVPGTDEYKYYHKKIEDFLVYLYVDESKRNDISNSLFALGY